MAELIIQTDEGWEGSVAFDDALLESSHFVTKLAEDGLVTLQDEWKNRSSTDAPSEATDA